MKTVHTNTKTNEKNETLRTRKKKYIETLIQTRKKITQKH